MRFIFKTDYEQDIRLAKHGGQVFWYSALLLFMLAAPWLLGEYWLAQLTFVLIYGIVGLGLMLLAGYTGQFSLGLLPPSSNVTGQWRSAAAWAISVPTLGLPVKLMWSMPAWRASASPTSCP